MEDSVVSQENIYKCVNYNLLNQCKNCDGYGRNMKDNVDNCYVTKMMVFEGQEGYNEIIGPAYLKFLDDKIVCYKNKFKGVEKHVQSEE
jgi:hypothetical protein